MLEVDQNVFEDKVHEFLKLISFDPIAEREIGNMFKKFNKWALFSFQNHFTAGLHSYERAEILESFNRSLKYDPSILQILEQNSKLESRDCTLQCNSKEAHAYMTHPVYLSISKSFSLYATSIMLHQLISAYQSIASTVSPSTYKVTTPSTSFSVSLTTHKTPTPNKNFSCSCPFFTTTLLICSHIFCVLNFLQVKNINNFAQLVRWREVGGKVPDEQATREERFL